jgi:ADP-ribose pyrophosphatase YjhB (NUDIX family)
VPEKGSHCTYCGGRFAEGVPWPRTCVSCDRTSLLNPTPVAVLLLPVGDGLLVVRRGIEPGRGKLALPGGFIDLGETWQEAAARELHEEAGVEIDPARVVEFRVRSARGGPLLVFGVGPRLAAAGLPPFVANDEATERAVIEAPRELAFPLHTETAAAWFAGRR